MLMGSSAATSPEGPGSVSGAPNLPEGFTEALVIPGCGHWTAEQAPEDLLAALTAFLAPYRDATAAE
jgi:pimeloyl-ACP methyl ester carboxylesterase